MVFIYFDFYIIEVTDWINLKDFLELIKYNDF